MSFDELTTEFHKFSGILDIQLRLKTMKDNGYNYSFKTSHSDDGKRKKPSIKIANDFQTKYRLID